MQGLDNKEFDPEELLEQQHQWEKGHSAQGTPQS
jgi:phospholipid-binding lipoprotein MlaA